MERSMAVKLEFREREAREQRDRRLAVIAEFGGEKPERMLVPEDDPANNELVLRLAGEVLFLRGQIRRIAKVMELVQAGKPFALIPTARMAHFDRSPHASTGIRVSLKTLSSDCVRRRAKSPPVGSIFVLGWQGASIGRPSWRLISMMSLPGPRASWTILSSQVDGVSDVEKPA
jgi:hypothetical protein